MGEPSQGYNPCGRNLTNSVRRKMVVVLRNSRDTADALLLVGKGKEDKDKNIF